ncbi:MAG: hypothetical protein KIT84_36760 [Labilithrix sp.]|nr:hypothetical protein [Labilithrix sp.]
MSALGAVGFACTIGSGDTNSDVDGGASSSSSSSSSGVNTSSSSSSSGGALECAAYTGPRVDSTGGPIFAPQECQSCLFTNCCAETHGCFNIENEKTENGKAGCFDYVKCVVTCEENNEGDDTKIDECINDFCKSTTFAEVPPAHDNFLKCRDEKCAMCP